MHPFAIFLSSFLQFFRIRFRWNPQLLLLFFCFFRIRFRWNHWLLLLFFRFLRSGVVFRAATLFWRHSWPTTFLFFLHHRGPPDQDTSQEQLQTHQGTSHDGQEMQRRSKPWAGGGKGLDISSEGASPSRKLHLESRRSRPPEVGSLLLIWIQREELVKHNSLAQMFSSSLSPLIYVFLLTHWWKLSLAFKVRLSLSEIIYHFTWAIQVLQHLGRMSGKKKNIIFFFASEDRCIQKHTCMSEWAFSWNSTPPPRYD